MVSDVDILFQIIEEKTPFNKETILSKDRKREIIDARRIFATILRVDRGMCLREVGEILGGLNHASICHYVKTHKILISSDYKYRKLFLSVQDTFFSSRNSLELKLKNKTNERRLINNEIRTIRKLIQIRDKKKPMKTKIFY